MTSPLVMADAAPPRRRPHRRRLLVRAMFLASLAIAAVLARLLFGEHSLPAHFADADDRAAVQRGKWVYMERCASCHGRYLQGQPLWQLADQNAGRRAPAHDQTGHTWQHSDEQLYHVTKYGKFAGAPAQAVSAMPGFKDALDDHEILAAIAFIKARWPTGLRVLQAMRNPGRAGMPPGADRGDWTFPPNCMAASQLASQNARARTP
jgi:S-disulfanyl-L-cysteine oxidoreductase SoxD